MLELIVVPQPLQKFPVLRLDRVDRRALRRFITPGLYTVVDGGTRAAVRGTSDMPMGCLSLRGTPSDQLLR
ncbi:hypothetical protein SCOCK_200020 [Actinacidiphila cocklensis]|uniref:Uncharacterized protein n=1 Tax=Actinacidiphila cocklensis TaxID=887465 RepID=A0A9W4GR76_9ACTN|nr:hypothetical protein SCOCK_200020 [Actinacidiphila cocklensis]